MANDLTFKQLSTVLNAICEQATGHSAITPTNTSEFVAVGQTALLAGYDPAMNAISQVLSKTIFSVRPYYEKFGGLRVDSLKWGNIVRKLAVVDSDFVNDPRYTLENGQTVDQFVVRKPEVLQLNYYGGDTVADFVTIFKDQLDTAFTGPDQFGSFISMVMQNMADKHSQARENLARASVANFIAGKVAGDSGSVRHLLTEYNNATGLSLTPKSVRQPDNYPSFAKWSYAEVATASSMMTERSEKFHINVTGKELKRHSPYARQKVFIYAPERFHMEARVLADAFHDNYLRYAANETVNFWQSIDTPNQIQVKPSYLNSNGGITTSTEAVTVNNVFSLIADEEAVGYSILREWMAPTVMDVAGGYHNIWYHFDRRYWNSFDENGIVFLMD